MTTYPLAALRAVVLHAQGLEPASAPHPDREAVFQTIHQAGCLQIDTLHMVRRSQYLALWSRLGNYNPDDLDALASAGDRRVFEGWQHAACFIPLEEYRYQLPRQRRVRERASTWYSRRLEEQGLDQAALFEQVLERIRREGPRKVSDFEEERRQPGGAWWNWRPAKVALEYWFDCGALMIAGRDKFQRVYDLTERVLPDWVERSEPAAAERDRFWVERGARAMGVGLPRHAGDYTWMKISQSRPIVAELVKEGALLSITGEAADGTHAELIVHRDHLPLLQQAADGALPATRTTFLSPFDSLWWAARRDELLWGFHQSIEAYLPAARRTYGYFCLPILHRGRLVGRFDPKLERKSGTLTLRALYLEPGVQADEELVHATGVALGDFMAFHAARQLVIERSDPADLAGKLLNATMIHSLQE